MPLIADSDYHPPLSFKNAHLQSIYSALFRRVEGVGYERERIETPDDDFLDLDWVKTGARRVAILSHGLEGSAQRSYVRGMARALGRQGWDVLAWNYRGCGGEVNRRLRAYHSGATDDLDLVVQHALGRHAYAQAALVGFSLGGNITLKYLGERGERLDSRIQAAVAFSVPCDLDASVTRIDRPGNWIYRTRFLRDLRKKTRRKQAFFPGALDFDGVARITSLRAFDDTYTAPIHGFTDAADYYARCSSLRFIPDIPIPTLLVNAADDPFLSEACYPVEAAHAHPHVYLEVPRYGGHVGFVAFNGAGAYWSEQRAVAFLGNVVKISSKAIPRK